MLQDCFIVWGMNHGFCQAMKLLRRTMGCAVARDGTHAFKPNATSGKYTSITWLCLWYWGRLCRTGAKPSKRWTRAQILLCAMCQGCLNSTSIHFPDTDKSTLHYFIIMFSYKYFVGTCCCLSCVESCGREWDRCCQLYQTHFCWYTTNWSSLYTHIWVDRNYR